MSKNEAKKANKTIRCSIIILSAALAAGAWMYNPAHLFTAAVLFAFGLECNFFNEERV
jgi:D-serine deaminase-like pyridoxal phosphate-dependent protein